MSLIIALSIIGYLICGLISGIYISFSYDRLKNWGVYNIILLIAFIPVLNIFTAFLGFLSLLIYVFSDMSDGLTAIYDIAQKAMKEISVLLKKCKVYLKG